MMDHAKIRLLLISDQEADAVLVRARLGEIPYTFFEWARDTSAGTLALEAGEHDLCLLDLDLCDVRGFELVERHGEETPIIVLVSEELASPEPVSRKARAIPPRAFDALTRTQIQEPLFERTLRYALERRSATLALRRSDASFRALIEQTPQAIFVHDRGRIVHVNARTLRDFGCDHPEQLVGRQLLDLIAKEDRPLLEGRIAGHEPQVAGLPLLCRFVLEGDDVISTEIVEIPVFWRNAPAVALLARDVAEHPDAQARLLLMDRFARGSALAASVAHEINNPLAYVTSNIVFALDELERMAESAPRHAEWAGRMEQVREALIDARQGTERVETITRDLKIFSQARDERKSSTDVHRVLELALNMTKPEVRARARLVTDFAQIPDIMANDGRLAHVFINLLLNAAQAIPAGLAHEHTIRIETRAERDGIVIEVHDTGLGMSEKVRERIFDPFFTTMPTARTGLGLFICQHIVQGLGGRITVESQLGRGSTFRVELPAKSSATLPVARAQAERSRILIVDDEPLVCSSLQRSLKRDYEVMAVQSARTAFELIRDGESFDLILCDLMMPEMSGMDLYEELHRCCPAQCSKLIFFTGGASNAGARAFLDRVPNARLEKPADIARIRELVREKIAS